MKLPQILRDLDFLTKQWIQFAGEWSNKGRPQCGTGVPLSLPERLHLSNFNLWNLENEVRRVGNPATQTANIKRMIDLENNRRNQLIEQIDEWLLVELRQDITHRDAQFHTETLGSILDRISVLCLRVHHFKDKVKSDSNDGDAADKLMRSEGTLVNLIEATQYLIEEVMNGSKKLFITVFLKDYTQET